MKSAHKIVAFVAVIPLSMAMLRTAEDAQGAERAGAPRSDRLAWNEWRPLFNGKDMTGWRLYGRQAPPGEGWKVEDGILKKVQGVRGGDIVTEEKFEDFELSWEWRVAARGNNGVKYLVTESRPGAPGHEYQLLDDDGHPDGRVGAHRQTAAFYDVFPPAQDKPLKPVGEWNESRILVNGMHVEHWLNAVKVLEYDLGSKVLQEALTKSKFKSFPDFGQKNTGHIMLTDHNDECSFRNMKIRELRR